MYKDGCSLDFYLLLCSLVSTVDLFIVHYGSWIGGG